MLAEIPSANRTGLPARLRLQDRASHQRATKRLQQTREIYTNLKCVGGYSQNHGGSKTYAGRERNSFIFDTDSGKRISERIYYDQAGLWNRCKGSRGRRWR